MVIRNSKTTSPLKKEKSTLIAKSMWKWVWGLKSLVCSESMHVLGRLLIVQPPIIHMQMFSHDPTALKELQRASVTLKDSILAHIITLLNWGQVGRKGSVFLSLPIAIQRAERERKLPCTAAQMLLNPFQRPFLNKHAPPLCAVIGYSFFCKYLIAWPCVFETWRTSVRSCF